MTAVPASIYDRKIVARHFDTIQDILQSLSLEQSLLEGRNALIWRSGNQVVKIRNNETNHAMYGRFLINLQAKPSFLNCSYQNPYEQIDKL